MATYVLSLAKRVKKWKGHFFLYRKDVSGKERRQHRAVILGLKAKMKKWEADRELQRIIEKETGPGVPLRADSSVTLGWFVRERYIPMREGRWRQSTRATTLGIINGQILPVFGTIPLCEIDKFTLQSQLNTLAKTYSHSVVDHVRNFLKSILEEAVELDFIARNPGRRLANPDSRKPVKRILTFDQLRGLLGCLSERDRLIIGIASICALRPGELFALKRKSFQGNQLRIMESVYRGKIGPTKTAASVAPVALPEALAVDLAAWLEKSVETNPEALIFPSQQGTPILKENFMRRVLKPAGEKARCPFVTFQVLRRTFATLAHDAGASLKDVQTQLRHSHVSTTAEVYTQAIPESVRATVEAFSRKLASAKLQ